jgi:hypothetical protein
MAARRGVSPRRTSGGPVGSITFCGSLSHNRYDNNVSRILRNVIERFRKPR